MELSPPCECEMVDTDLLFGPAAECKYRIIWHRPLLSYALLLRKRNALGLKGIYSLMLNIFVRFKLQVTSKSQ
jgi:hypothetical protein